MGRWEHPKANLVDSEIGLIVDLTVAKIRICLLLIIHIFDLFMGLK